MHFQPPFFSSPLSVGYTAQRPGVMSRYHIQVGNMSQTGREYVPIWSGTFEVVELRLGFPQVVEGTDERRRIEWLKSRSELAER
jgi:hypothetical protein